MKLKTLSAACLAGALLCPSLTAYAGIPVMVDADPLRQIQYATDAQNWLKTVEQYKSQLNAYKSQLATATGVRNVQDFLSQAKGLSSDLKNLQKNGISLNDLLTKSTKSVRTADGKLDPSVQKEGVGTLQGDSATVSLQNSLRMLTQGISGSTGGLTRLAEIGIQMQEGGKLSTDTTKLDKALTNLEGLKGLFANKADALGQGGGIAVNFKNFTDKLLSFDGTLNTKTDSLERTLKSNSAEQTKVNTRADTLEKRLYAQYSALDTKMASLNALNAYVSQMVTTWNKAKS
mgnify:CR=1 FL=1